MDRIWAPWRKAYIRPSRRKDKTCLFCRLLAQRRDARNFILKRNPSSFAVLNLYPYNNGHLMIVPNRHVVSLRRLSDKERLDWLSLYDEMLEALTRVLRPHGVNAGINLGKIAGAGVPGHLHLHVVPRWQGDSNFMPVIGETKVISESLKSVYQSMRKYLQSRSKKV